MSDKNYQYETKCRKCGKINEWHFSNISAIDYFTFLKAISDYIADPRSYRCECVPDTKETIQDVVSHSKKCGE